MGRREIVGKFDAPAISSDAGGLLLRELDQKFDLIGKFADCFDDFRDPELIRHSARELLAQRVFDIALGYEDLNDHEQLRHDPVMAVLAGRFFYGYYKCYCYLPLYIFCGQHLLCAKLRPSNIDAPTGSVGQLERIVKHIRSQWPEVKIVIRGDDGFCREKIMCWCESNNVDFVLGLAKNARLKRVLGKELHQARQLFQASGKPARVFKDFEYQAQKSWCRKRRVIGKAEHLNKESNPRFVVTSLSVDEMDAQTLYEKKYCARGEMENRIKEQQLHLFADRTSASTMRANQLRLWLSSVAYVLVNALREKGLAGTELEKAQCHTIRLKLFKIGAAIQVSCRKVWVLFSAAYPLAETFLRILSRLKNLPVTPRHCLAMASSLPPPG